MTTTKNKKQCTEIEIEEESVEREWFWEQPIEFDNNIKWTLDPCIVPEDQITIPEINENSIADTTYEEVFLKFIFNLIDLCFIEVLR